MAGVLHTNEVTPMAELLVRVKDKINEDFYLNCQCTKAGDVICIQPDGWNWGREELKNPDWRIIKMPGVKESDLSAFLQPELPVDPMNPPKTLQRRAFRLHLDGMPADVKACAADDTRQVAVIATKLQAAHALALKVARPAIADPAVIGEAHASLKVIG